MSETAAWYAYDYYQKWLQFGENYYLPYEEKLLRLFQVTA